MLDPHHSCWWTDKYKTGITRSNRFTHPLGEALVGAGTGIHIPMSAFIGEALVWFSVVYGDHDDNLLLAALDPAHAATIPNKESYDTPSLLQTAFPTDFPFEEFRLTPEVQSLLHIQLDDEDDEGEAVPFVAEPIPSRYEVHFHDECFFAVRPLTPHIQRQLLGCVLQMHSFFLQTEVEWSLTTDWLTTLINTETDLELQSFPLRQELIVSWKNQSPSRIQRFLHSRLKQRISVQDGIARLANPL